MEVIGGSRKPWMKVLTYNNLQALALTRPRANTLERATLLGVAKGEFTVYITLNTAMKSWTSTEKLAPIAVIILTLLQIVVDHLAVDSSFRWFFLVYTGLV
jgi:hypothetical protein